MEKRFREYIRHLEKLDFEVLSEEEIITEREGILLQITVLHQDMLRSLVASIGFLICAAIFLSAGFSSFFFVNFIFAAVFAIVSALFALRFKGSGDVMKTLYTFVDKLARLAS